MRLAAFAAGLLLCASSAFAAPPTTVQDPNNVNNNLTVNSDGSANVTCVSGCSGGGGGGAVTAASGAFVDGYSPNLGVSTDAASCASGTSLLACSRQFHADATAGVAAPATTYPSSAVATICRAATTSPTAVTDGQGVAPMCSKGGKTVVDLYAPSDLRVSGTATSTDTGAHTIIAAGAGSLKNYITGVQCGRTDAGTSPILITFSDAQSTKMVIPDAGNGGGNNMDFASPIVTAAATAFTFTSGTGVTTAYCNAQGYQAP